MREVPLEVLAAMSSDSVFPITMFEIGGNPVLRYNTTDKPVLWNGHVWLPRAVSSSKSNESLGLQIAEYTVEIDNYDQALTAWSRAKNPIGFNTTCYEGYCNGTLDGGGNLLLIADFAVIEFSGLNTSIKLDIEFSITVRGRYDMARSRGPSRDQFTLCRFRGLTGSTGFKGFNCGYAGPATSCNFTFARCTQLGNELRFGGFPDIDA